LKKKKEKKERREKGKEKGNDRFHNKLKRMECTQVCGSKLV